MYFFVTPAAPTRFTRLAFYPSLLLVIIFFIWSRVNSSDYVYLMGDGTGIVALIQEMLASGDWTADFSRIADRLSLQEEWQPYTGTDLPRSDGHYFNLSGYIVVATAVCALVQAAGGFDLSIPFILHGFNVLLQTLTLCLLFNIGRQMAGRWLGLLGVLFFTLLPLAVTEAHYERPESWLAFLSSLILFALLQYEQAPRRSLLTMGMAMGFSLAVKFSQLFLGLIPLCLFACVLGQADQAPFSTRWRRVVMDGVILGLGLIAVLAINVPFVLTHLPEYFHEVRISSSFYDIPHPMYSMAHYDYVSQLGFISHYFHSTLGIAWCVLLLLGFYKCFFSPVTGVSMPLYYRLSLVLPPLFLLFFFSTKDNFTERTFAATEPMLCMVSALAFYSLGSTLRRLSIPAWIQLGILPVLLALVLASAFKLNYVFVQNHIRQAGYVPRITFQENLKKDFPGFWIKNVHVTLGFVGAIPEKPGKAPRIYHLEDYNQYWSAPHGEKLRHSGFVLIATYCSDFAELPASNHTIYHAAAKNHYWVRQEEWPATVAPGYFKTNCP